MVPLQVLWANMPQRQANATRLLAAERSAYLLAQQEEIRQKSKQYQDLLAQIDLAGSQKRLAGLLAGLDAERTAVELAHAKGETSALGHALALNTIDQNRLAAQKAVLERQLALLRARTDGTPDDIKAREAQVTQLEAQLVDVRSRIEQEAGKAVTIAASDALAKSQETAAEWVQTWQRSFSLIRDLARQNAAALATSIDDPFQRAEAEAKVRTAAAREQLDAQQADLQRQIDSLAGKAAQGLIIEPGMRDELLRQMKDLAARGAQAIEEQARSARFDSFRQQFAELAEALSLQEQSLAAQVEAGALSTEEAEQRKFAARAKALPQLEIYRKALDALAKSPAERNQVAQIVAETEKLKQKVSELQRVISSSFEGSVKGLFVDLATGAKTALEAFRDFVAGIARLALDLIAQAFAKRIAKSIFGDGGNAGTGEGGTAGSAIGAAIVSFFAGMFHRGGIVGEGSSSGSRAVSPAAFAWAPRYHSSGIVGLKPRERAIIAEDGEEVLDEGNPRHIRNFRGSGIGDVTINTVVQGAQGSTSDLRGAGDDLARVINSAIEGWASRESRQGGKLAIRGA